MLLEALRSAGICVPEDASEADWIEPDLKGEVGAVGNIIPRRYAACARILHPATSPEGKPVRWQYVSEQTGRVMHRLVQWHALVGSRNPDDLGDSEWRGAPPERGLLSGEIWDTLSAIASGQIAGGERMCCAQWTGWASVSLWLTSLEASSSEQGLGEVHYPIFGLPPLAGRDYLLFEASLPQIAEFEGLDPFARLPNIIWPSDRTWFLATDIDFDSTLVAGTEKFIQSIIQSDALEAWQVFFDDSLAYDADTVNRRSS